MLIHEPVMGLDRGQPRRVQLGEPGLQLGEPGRGVGAAAHGVEVLGRGAQPGGGGARLREPRFQRGDPVRQVLPGSLQGGDPFPGGRRGLLQPVPLGFPLAQAPFVVHVVPQRGGGGLRGRGPGRRGRAAPAGERVLVRLRQQAGQVAGRGRRGRDGLGE